MLAIDVMTPAVVTASPDTSIPDLCRLMLESRISALPVVDAAGSVVGMITEGDLLRRCESGTEKKRAAWVELFVSNSQLAAEYVKSHGRKAKDIMTTEVVTVSESTSLRDIADLLEKHGIKRVPVLREKRLVGVVSRANLLQALVATMASRPEAAAPKDDAAIRAKLVAEFADKSWRPSNVIVRHGIAHLWGEVTSEEERAAMRVAAENTPGVEGVKDHTTYPVVWPPFG
ncbi:CBS domain-containing protein [Dongia sp.]|uniref:CBS domain-containing protein n=1 Tax=Dongia sp. TaxID=1977262 RepID=UPI0035ADF4AB